MKKSIYITIMSVITLLIVNGCNEIESVFRGENLRTVQASFEDKTTRVSLVPAANSADMITKWQQDDKIHVILMNGTQYIDVGRVPVRDISENGKSCIFQYALPKELESVAGYGLSCFTDICSPEIIDGDVYYNASLMRMPISQFKARVMFDQYVEEENCFGSFTHYGTYELLHVTNNSDKDISFSLCGFEADLRWYKEVGGIRLFDKSMIVDFRFEKTEKSPTITIPAHSSDIIVSWYIPNGNTIQEATLVAEIDGEFIHSTNTISSNVTLCTGIAYHMFATWDGCELKFTKRNPEAPSTIKLEPTEIDFGEATIGETKSEFLKIINSGEEQAEVKVSIEGTNNIYTENFEIVDAELGDNYFIINIPPGGYYNAEIHFRASAVEDYYGKLVITSDGIQGGSCVVPLKGKGIEEDKSFHLSANSIEMHVNTEELVMILNGSGEYEVTNENPDIVDYDINGTHVAKSPRRGDGTTGGQMSDDCWWITAKKVGNATLRLKDKKTNEELTLKVKVISSSNLSCPDNHHPHMIDLGLPSGTLWACCNVGASKPEDYGGYYAWGETEEKDYYDWSNYIHCDGSYETCHDLGPDISGTNYDVAHVKWGNGWQMPTWEQFKDLTDNCSLEWTYLSGIKCRKITGHNGGVIYLPAAGFRGADPNDNPEIGDTGFYWSSTPCPDDPSYAWDCIFSIGPYWDLIGNRTGRSVRPVKNSGNTSVTISDEL